MTDVVDTYVEKIREDEPGWNPRTMGNRRGSMRPRRRGPRAPERGRAAAKKAASMVRRRRRPASPGRPSATGASRRFGQRGSMMSRLRARTGNRMRQRKSRMRRSAFRRGFGKGMDTELQQVVDKYNPYHGKDGKFTSASRGGGARAGAKAQKRPTSTPTGRGGKKLGRVSDAEAKRLMRDTTAVHRSGKKVIGLEHVRTGKYIPMSQAMRVSPRLKGAAAKKAGKKAAGRAAARARSAAEKRAGVSAKGRAQNRATERKGYGRKMVPVNLNYPGAPKPAKRSTGISTTEQRRNLTQLGYSRAQADKMIAQGQKRAARQAARRRS